MKIFTGEQIKEADKFTIENEPISSIGLMERASETIAQAICETVEQGRELLFFIGKGNNGGDGLAVARILSNAGFTCRVVMLYNKDELSEDSAFNFSRLPKDIKIVTTREDFVIDNDNIIIDAILGTGVKGEISDYILSFIDKMNDSGCEIISIDLPSGMKTEFGNDPSRIVNASLTLTLQFPKLAMLLPEAGNCCGRIEVLPIDLHPEFVGKEHSYKYVNNELIKSFIKHRSKFSNKGDYGHLLLICGSSGMVGASILATNAALRSGCGLVTTHIPGNYASSLHNTAPSAMVSSDVSDCFSELPSGLDRFNSIGIGCGLGKSDKTKKVLKELMERYKKPMVIDADALNIISLNPELKKLIHPESILTPHPGELKRLVGEWRDESEKISLSRGLALELSSIIVVKGAHSMICTPSGSVYFNSTGTPGMSKGGSGDVLTGLIAGLLARGYSSEEASLAGVFIHGKAGEKAAEYYGIEGMNSSDIVDFLGEATAEIG